VTALLLPSALVIATIYFGTGSVWPESPRKSPAGTVVVWGDRSFTTRRGFEMWLEANGGDYRRWAKRHPAAAALLSRQPRARRAVARSTPSRSGPSAVSIERRAYFALVGLAAGVLGFVSISVVRRLPRPSIPALALGVYGSNAGRFVAESVPSAQRLRVRRPRPSMTTLRPRVGPAAENARSLLARVRDVYAWCVSAAWRVFPAPRKWDRFDLVFGAISVAGGLAVGILVPLVLAQ
jgi:hypothetical protein